MTGRRHSSYETIHGARAGRRRSMEIHTKQIDNVAQEPNVEKKEIGLREG